MRSAIAVAATSGVAALLAGVALSGGTVVDPPVPHGFPGVVPAFMTKPGGGGDIGVGGGGAAGGGGPQPGRRTAMRRDRRWLERSRPLGRGAPRWARRMYRRSLLVLRAAVDPHSGAAVAGARAGWRYVWPRDSSAVAIALAGAGYRDEARKVVRFLFGLDLGAAARFDEDGEPVEGRAAQGDAAGWVVAAARATGLSGCRAGRVAGADGDGGRAGLRMLLDASRGHADYQEKDDGDYLGNALASAFAAERSGQSGSAVQRPGVGLESRREPALALEFETKEGLVRRAGDSSSGLDTAAAWAVRPFPRPELFAAAGRTLAHLIAERGSRFGLLPSEDWDGGEDPWTAPTAWSAWALAALAGEESEGAAGGRAARDDAARRDRRAALTLLTGLRRAATPLGLLPERVDAAAGVPASATPLAWSHAFAILALRELWPGRAAAASLTLPPPASSASAPAHPPCAAVR